MRAPLFFRLINKFSKPLKLNEISDIEREQVEILKEAFRKINKIPEDNLQESERIWVRFMNSLKLHVENDDPRFFLLWKEIRTSMFTSNSRASIDEFRYLKKSGAWNEKWKNAIHENPMGQPMPFPYYRRSSPNLIHHAYHLAKYENELGQKDIEDMDFVFEFGGGYGSMCRLFNNLSFNGKYVIFDLPHFTALQKFYLRSLGYNVVDDLDTFIKSEKAIYCFSESESIMTIMNHLNGSDRCLFLATWSISEAPLNIRDYFIPSLGLFSHILLAFQDNFAEINNVEYFEKVRAGLTREYLWKTVIIDNIPNNRYLFASSK